MSNHWLDLEVLPFSVASWYCCLDLLWLSVVVFLLCFFWSICLWPFFWLCILSFIWIKLIPLSQKRECWAYLKLAKITSKYWEVLNSSSPFFIKPIDKLYSEFQFWLLFDSAKYESHLVFLFIISFWLIVILLYLISKNIISSCRRSCYIYILNFLNGMDLWLLKGKGET